ncbi:hypothetical protein RDI58_002083 [Solanum bulbocastanum]|uniref:DUF4216 domain-containing protein n=1 Tax=Solanum bulbocastanum TaxID=147425 RepID=A0AAN8YQS0_SOLBU
MPRLQRLFMSTKTSTLMTWHKDKRVDGIMRHLADSMALKSFDELHPSFAVEPRNVRFRLASDGFQPFRNSKTSHSIWLVAQLHKQDYSQIMKDLLSLLCGPTKYSTRSNGYVVNGYRFHVEDYDNKLRTQNCGVVVLDENDEDSENLDYYGVLTNVIELQFVIDRRVILFQCNWFDVYDEIKGVKKDEFKMKSLKTENEVDSNMKSTIRYTFVAPGAIGKGQGRGLKSLGEKGSLTSKGLLPQSSDLVKKYIKEIETRKGLEKRNRSLSSSLEISEYEVGSFNKSVDFDTQHMETPSKSTKLSSNMSSNHEMQNMKKLFLRKRICKPMFHYLHLLMKL